LFADSLSVEFIERQYLCSLSIFLKVKVVSCIFIQMEFKIGHSSIQFNNLFPGKV